MADAQKPDEQTPIPYWGYYAQMTPRGGGFLQSNPEGSPPARQFIEAVRKYDPNATWTQFSPYSGVYAWRLSVDESKLPGGGWPGAEHGRVGVDLNPNAFDPMYWTPESSPGESWSEYETFGGANGRGHNMQGQVRDPAQVQSSDVYGNWTPRSNWESPDSGDALFRMLGLAGVGAFAFGMPALANAMTGGATAGGELLPLMPNPDPYTPMLPFNPADPSYNLLASPAAGATTGGGLSGELLPLMPNANPYNIMSGEPYAIGGGGGGLDQTLLPLIPNENPYNPMLPFNPADPSYSGLPHGLLDRFRNAAGDVGSAMGKLPPGLLGGTQGGLGVGGGGGRGGAGSAITSEDALAILSRFWGVKEEVAKRLVEQGRQEGQRNGF